MGTAGLPRNVQGWWVLGGSFWGGIYTKTIENLEKCRILKRTLSFCHFSKTIHKGLVFTDKLRVFHGIHTGSEHEKPSFSLNNGVFVVLYAKTRVFGKRSSSFLGFRCSWYIYIYIPVPMESSGLTSQHILRPLPETSSRPTRR